MPVQRAILGVFFVCVVACGGGYVGAQAAAVAPTPVASPAPAPAATPTPPQSRPSSWSGPLPPRNSGSHPVCEADRRRCSPGQKITWSAHG